MAEATKDAKAALIELVRSTAQTTVEYVHDEYKGEHLWAARYEIVQEVVDCILAHASDDPDAEINRALRAIGGGS